MAYRRKQSMPRSATIEEYRSPPVTAEASIPVLEEEEEEEQPPSLAAQAIRASSAHRDSSLSSAYGESAFSSAYRETNRQRPSQYPQDSTVYEYTSMKNLNESKYGFWGVLTRKAKSILDDDNVARQFEDHGRNLPQTLDTSTASKGQFRQPYRSSESYRNTDNPAFQKGSESIASSLNYIGGTIKNALEEGLTIVENRTADIIQETRKLQIRRKLSGSGAQNLATNIAMPQNVSQSQTNQETQLKASRDVANAMAAKAKLLLRELKTVKADLAFAKERCSQLEDENKILRESRQKGDNHEDDDLLEDSYLDYILQGQTKFDLDAQLILDHIIFVVDVCQQIRLQLETLLAEKGRLAHENSVYARENRFLREIVEYHQLTMQDVVYLDEGIEEVTEVYPIHIPHHSQYSTADAPGSTSSTPTSKASMPPSPNTMVSSDSFRIIPASSTLQSPIVIETLPAVAESTYSPSAAGEGARRQRSPTP